MAKLLSIEIGYSSTKLVLMDYQSKKPKIYKCAEIPTPQDTIIDGYIEIDNIEILKDTIKKALKTNKIRAKKVVFSVFSSKIITREIILPPVKEHQINAVIESNVTEYFPIELNDYKIAHIKLDTFKTGDNAGKHKVLVIAAEKRLLEGYEKLALLLKLNLVDIDYSGNSTYQSISRRAGANPIMAIRAENDNATITIAKEGRLIMQRNVNYNQEHLLDEDLHVLTSTVTRLIDFYALKYEDAVIEKVYLLGAAMDNRELAETIQYETQIITQALGEIKGVALTRKTKKSPLAEFANAIGAGISSVGLDNEREKQRHETNYVSASILMIFLVIALAAALIVRAIVPYSEATHRQESLETKRAELEPAKEVYDQYNAMLSLIAKVRYGQALTRNSNDSIVEFLEELEKTLPSDVEVSDFTSSDSQCVISMRVANKETAAGVINNLRQFESIKSLTVNSITEETLDSSVEEGELTSKNTVISFTLTATYNVETPVEP